MPDAPRAPSSMHGGSDRRPRIVIGETDTGDLVAEPPNDAADPMFVDVGSAAIKRYSALGERPAHQSGHEATLAIPWYEEAVLCSNQNVERVSTSSLRQDGSLMLFKAIMSVAVAALALSCSALAQNSAPWPIKEFEVLNVEPAGEVAPFGAFVRLLREADIDLDNPFDLDLWQTVPLEDGTRQVIEDHLRASAGLLERWGFPAPALGPVVETRDGRDAYRVFLVRDLEGHAGEYHPLHCWAGNETVILLDADDVLDESGRITLFGLSAVGHELFHAVQYATPFLENRCGEDVGHWIVEGQARAVGWDLVRALTHMDPVSAGMGIWSPRKYSIPLPIPRRTPGARSDPAYETGSFWRYLAEFQALQEPPGPEVNPFDYTYLAHMLARPAAQRDCSTAGAACASELRWLDLGVQQAFGFTLQELFPRFVDSFAAYGTHRLQDPVLRSDWQAAVFDLPRRDASSGCENVYFTPEPGNLVHRDVIERFEPVAAECWSVFVEGFDRAVTVRIDVEAPPGSTALSDLSAVIAGRPVEVTTPSIRIDRETGQPTATWWETFPLDESRLFVLTNVAIDPANTTRMLNLPIAFTVVHPYVVMSVSGGESGEGGSDADQGSGADRGPTPADIARRTPIDFDLAEGDFTLFHEEGVCLAWIELRSEHDDALRVVGQLTPPITPGTYPIVAAGDVHLDAMGSELFSPRYNEGGYSLLGQSGILEIESVSPLMISGRIEAQLGRGGVRAEVHAAFALQPGSGVGGLLGGKAADHPCLTPADATPRADAPSGRPRPSGEPPSDEPTIDETAIEDDETNEPETPEDPEGPRGIPTPPGEPGEASIGDGEDGDAERALGDPADGDGAAMGASVVIEFLPNEGGSIRSRPQSIRGSADPEAINVSSDAFALQLGLPMETVSLCSGPESRLDGMFLLIGQGVVETAPRGGQTWSVIEIGDAVLELDVTGGALRLVLDYESCGLGRCGTSNLVVSAPPGSVGIERTGSGSVRVDVADAAIEGTVAEHPAACSGLLDFSFTLNTGP